MKDQTRKDAEEFKELLLHSRNTGEIMERLLELYVEQFQEAQKAWCRKNGRIRFLDHLFLLVMYKTAKYCLRKSKTGKMALLEGDPPADQTQWRCRKMILQQLAYVFRLYARATEKNKDPNSWLSSRFKFHEKDPVVKALRKILARRSRND